MEQATPAVAIVTGARHGIGRAIVEHLRAAGTLVAACDLVSSGAPEEQGTLELVADLTDSEQRSNVLAEVHAKFGEVSILVNNAARVVRAAAQDITESDMRSSFAVNVEVPLAMSQLVLPDMIAKGGGSIVNVTSISGTITTEPGLAAYGATKTALEALTRALAIEWGVHQIRCNAVAPGSVRTPSTEIAYSHPEVLAARIEAVPLKRIVTTREIAATVAFLASPLASGITGTTIVVDGGLSTNLFGLVPGRAQIAASEGREI